jgi:hypothetical protein
MVASCMRHRFEQFYGTLLTTWLGLGPEKVVLAPGGSGPLVQRKVLN